MKFLYPSYRPKYCARLSQPRNFVAFLATGAMCLVGCTFFLAEHEKLHIDRTELQAWQATVRLHGGELEWGNPQRVFEKATHVICESLRHVLVPQVGKQFTSRLRK